jgi:hypothetical protein
MTQPTHQRKSKVEEDVHEEEIDERVVAGSILDQHAQCHDSGHKLSFTTETVTSQLCTYSSWIKELT